jgi:hypothetical protein
MTDACQWGSRRELTLPAFLGAALLTLAVLVPPAYAAPDPVGSGTTTVALKIGFAKGLRERGVKILGISPATLEGNRLTLPIEGGSFDPLTDQGSLAHGGGIKLRLHRKVIALTNFELDTATSSLAATVDGKTLTVASLVGLTFGRAGIGAEVGARSLNLTTEGAEALNAALGPKPRKEKKGTKGKALTSAVRGTEPSPLFKANQVIGHAGSTSQPTAVTLVPGGEMTLTTETAMVQKLTKIGVTIEALSPTTSPGTGTPPTFSAPIVAGNLPLDGSCGGALETSVGVKLVQNLETFGGGVATFSLGDIWLDLGAKTATASVIVEGTATAGPSLGALGRVSNIDLSLGSAITLDPATRRVSLQNINATMQAALANILNSVFVKRFEAATESKGGSFATGEQFGTFAFTAQGQ